MLNCDFREALKLTAVLAGVDLRTLSPTQRRRITAQQRKERRLELAAEQYVALERRLARDSASRLRLLDRLERFAAFCLRDSVRVESDCTEFWWGALARVYGERWHTFAAWLLLGFGAEDRRQRFVLYADQRPAVLAAVFDTGGVANDDGHFWELVP